VSVRRVAAALPLAALLAAPPLGAAEPDAWSRFRGPNGSGVVESGPLPAELRAETRIWRVPLPSGFSSPVLDAERIYLTGLDGEALVTLALERTTGRTLWRREAPRPRREKLDRRNHPAAASPVTDGERVFVFFADFGLLAYTTAGDLLWQHAMGPFDNLYGMGASPVLVGDLLVMLVDQSTGSYLLALDAETGAPRWRSDRAGARSGHATPIVYRPGSGGEQILVAGSFRLTAYAAEDGAPSWWADGLSFEIKSTPVISSDTLYINGYGSPLNQPGRQVRIPDFEAALRENDSDGDGRLSPEECPEGPVREWFGFVDLDRSGMLDAEDWSYLQAALASTNGLLAIALGGSGDVTDSAIRWTYHRAVPQLPSPLLFAGVLYTVNDGGIVTSIDPKSGERLAQGRLAGAIDTYYASPVAADGKIWFVSEHGKVAVIEPGGGLEVLALSDLGEACYATPALSEGRLYLRTQEALYAFGASPPTP
jgi:outer membrane protein assembly factor BamB